MESMFREFMEVMNESFHQNRSTREGNKATNDSLTSLGRNNYKEQVTLAYECNL